VADINKIIIRLIRTGLMLQSILIMGGLGIAMGAVLAIASKAFYVYEDPKVVAIGEVLPGANCGGCGYPGCSANAEAIVKGESGVNSCVAAGDEVAVAIAGIMGVSVSDSEPEFASPGCDYGNDDADLDYEYMGITDCRAAVMLFGGMKTCRIGCIGLGTCVRACMFGALSIGSKGLPEVDQEKCTGCGACERACPKHIIRLTSVTRRIIREYTVEDCVTPCQRACPTGIDIKKYIRLIKEGDYAASVQVIKERNPFPTVISRICPAPCETRCRRLLTDESVAINHLKRFVCDYEMNRNDRSLPYKAPLSGKKIAIIGGGVEGLSAAFFSARLGHEASVFEATQSLGGVLRRAIDRKRLPMEILEWDIEGIRQMGVDIHTQTRAGRDFTIDSLLAQGFDAVFTATGGWDSKLARGDIGMADNVFPGAFLLIDLLRSKTSSSIEVSTGKNIVIAGSGRMLTEAVNILKDKGAENIIIVSRRSSADFSLDRTATQEMTQKGVQIIHNAGITKVAGENEKLVCIEYTSLDTGEKHVVEADTLLIGSGRFPELVFIPACSSDTHENAESGESCDMAWEGRELHKKPDSNRELGLLSDQDPTSEYPSVVAAINGGRKAAAAIHHIIYDIAFPEPSKLITDNSVIQDVFVMDDVPSSARNMIQSLHPVKKPGEEFSSGFILKQAEAEAGRCLQCGLLCYERNHKITQDTI
jgi:NADPH-dependent glutamate synthase beta subunit-like oxidoreductase